MLQGIRWLPAAVRMEFFFPCALHNWLDALERELGRRLEERRLEALAENFPGWGHTGNGLVCDEQPIIIWLIIFVSYEHSAFRAYFCKLCDEIESLLYLESDDLDSSFGQQHTLWVT